MKAKKFASWIESLSPSFLNETFTDPMGQNPKTRFEQLIGAKEHEMHHRGQLMLIQRMLGLTPHLTRQMQERHGRTRGRRAGDEHRTRTKRKRSRPVARIYPNADAGRNRIGCRATSPRLGSAAVLTVYAAGFSYEARGGPSGA